VIAGVPQKIDEISRTAAALYNESVAEMQADTSGSSTFDRVRTQSLLRVSTQIGCDNSNSRLTAFYDIARPTGHSMRNPIHYYTSSDN